MKRTALFLALALAGGPETWAQTEGGWSTSDGSGVAAPTVVSQYLFRGVRRGGLSLQPTIEGDFGNLAIGVWANQPLRDKVPGVSDPEIDPYVTYTLNLTDALSVQPTLYAYTYVRAPLDQGAYHATFEPNLALNYTWRGVRITPKYYYDLELEGPTYELNVSTAVPLPTLGTELDFTGTVGTFLHRNVVNGATPKVKNWGDYWLVGVAVPFAITRASRITLGLAYTKGSGNFLKQGTQPKVRNAAAVGRAVVSLGWSWTF